MRTSSTAQRGSVVLVALCLTIVLGIAVAGYVALCGHTMVLSNRSFCYTSSTQLAETGLEQALWTLNQAQNTPGYTWPGWNLSTPVVNGISTPTATMEPLTGFATNKGVPGVVNVRVENYSSASPRITAHGILQMPDGITIDKELKIQVQPASAFFSGAVGAFNSIGFSSDPYNTDAVDSYTSSLGDYSDQQPTDQAIVSAPNVSVNRANILGYVATNGSAPIFTAPGTVKGLHTPAGTDRDLTRIITNTSQNLFDILPDENLPVSALGTWDDSNLSPSSLTRFFVNDLTVPSGNTLTIAGPVIIVVSGNLSIRGSIVIADRGSAQIIVNGSIDIQGGGIDNQTKIPKNLAIFHRGTSGNHSNYPYFEGATYTARLETSVPFYGVIYDPYGSLLVHGSTVYGSLVANVVAVRGDGAIHYDLDLRRATTTFSALNTPYVAQWIEN